MMNGDGYRNHANGTSNGHGAQHGEVIAYLARLGLGVTELGKIAALLEAIRYREHLGSTYGRDTAQPTKDDECRLRLDEDRWRASDPLKLVQFLHGNGPAEASHRVGISRDTPGPAQRKALEDKSTLRLYMAEEQQVFKLAYQSFFESHPSVEILGVSGDTSIESIRAASRYSPDVFLLGLKALKATSGVTLNAVKEACPSGVGLVLLFACYDAKGIRALREFSKEASGGRAYLLKHNLDTPEQLAQVVFSVAEGRVIVDPIIMGELIDDTGSATSLLFDLSRKELQVLSWMARGYGDHAIASVLGRDVKTVERQVADIYSKISVESAHGDRRVSAALSYLKATGLLPSG